MISSSLPLPDDIYFASDMLIYGDPAAGGFASKGFRIEPLDLSGASEDYREDIHDRLARFVQGLDATERLQWQWRVTPDYEDVLDSYESETVNSDCSDDVLSTRRARASYYRSKLAKRQLRREELTLFVSVRMPPSRSPLAGKKRVAAHYEAIIGQLANNFSQIHTRLTMVFGEAIKIAPLTESDCFQLFYRFLNPSCDSASGTDFQSLFDPTRTVQDLCCNSDVHPFQGTRLYMDGHYHALLTLKRLGRYTFTGIINALTALPLLNYQITLTIVPRDPEREVKTAQAAAETLEGEQSERFRRNRQVGIDKLDARIHRISAEHAKPFDLLFTIRAWAEDESTLSSHIAAIRNAVQSMRGAETYEVALPASTASLFVSSWPGNAFCPYRDRFLYVEDSNLADLIPFSSSFVGLLDEPEAIYEGAQRQLVGIRTFVGDTPQHMTLFGASGAGKSVLLQDLLNQTAPGVGYTFILEEGASHTEFTKRHGGRTIVVHPDAPYAINLFDTGSLPLTRTHVSFAVSLLNHMAGKVESTREANARKALLNYYVQTAYDGQFDDWSSRHPDLLKKIQREAYAVHLWHTSSNDPDASLLDSFVTIRDGLRDNDSTICEFVANLSEDDILVFTKTPATARRVSDHAFSYFEPEDFQSLAQFCEFMTLHYSPEHPKDVVSEIATNLRSWTADEGTFGGLFDGATNIRLDSRVVHFELSRIPNDQPDLKAAIALLIASRVRQHIYSLPRSVRKQVLLEEMARYINIPDAAQLVAELYAQMRKTGTWVCAVVQQYAQFRDSPVRPVIIGNSKQFIFFRQQDPADLLAAAEDTGLPDAMRHAISRYPIPADMPDNDRYSSFCYHVSSRVPSISGTVHNRLPQ